MSTIARAPGRRSLALLCALASPTLLGGCSDLSKAFGFTRNSPDEFTVTTRAPLAIPSSEALPAPRPGTPRPQEQDARLQALEAIAPDVALQGTAGPDSRGQDALRDAAQARVARRPGTGEITGSGGGLVGDVMFWQRRPSNIIVNADRENQRLRQAASDGQDPGSGPTPTVAPE